MTTFREVQQSRKFPKGAWDWIVSHYNKNNTCKPEWQAVIDEGKKNSAEFFKQCLQTAEESIPKNTPDREIHVMTMAENLCCSEGHAPPHFQYVSECDNCGEVLSPYPHIKHLDECSWCRSGYTQSVKEIMNSKREDPRLPQSKKIN